jgi:hypothetical protein
MYRRPFHCQHAGGFIRNIGCSTGRGLHLRVHRFHPFCVTLAGIGIFHRYSLQVTLTGLAAITLKKIFLTGFSEGQGLTGLIAHLGREWVVLANLFLLPGPHKEQAQRIERTQE